MRWLGNFLVFLAATMLAWAVVIVLIGFVVVVLGGR
jgi:hypothetical protein